jgi:hypothetical protein
MNVQVDTNVLEGHIASIFRAGDSMFLCNVCVYLLVHVLFFPEDQHLHLHGR